MTDLRKAAEALRLAEILSDGNPMDCLEHSADAAAELLRLHEENEALRQALAQQDSDCKRCKGVGCVACDSRQILAQPEQEQVDWEAVSADQAMTIAMMKIESKRKWVGLTDNEIKEFKQLCHLSGLGYDSFIQRFAIGIETKLKEKNFKGESNE